MFWVYEATLTPQKNLRSPPSRSRAWQIPPWQTGDHPIKLAFSKGKVKVEKSLKFVCFWLGKICFVEVESMKVFKFLPQKNWRWIKVSILKFWVSSFKSVFFPLLKHFYPILMGIFVTIIPWGSRSSYIPRFWGSRTNEKNQQNAKCHWEKLVCSNEFMIIECLWMSNIIWISLLIYIYHDVDTCDIIACKI